MRIRWLAGIVRADERGVSAVIVALSLLALFGAALLSVDAGNLWQTRRHMITATDAAALHAAQNAATGGVACADYDTVLIDNAGSSVEPIDCVVNALSALRTGYVVVEARKAAEVRFGGIFGIDDKSAYSLSAAQFGFITATTGLRPIGVCVQNTHVQWWIAQQAAPPGVTIPELGGDHPAPGVHRIYFNKENPAACADSAPGNWGFLDFLGNGGSRLRTPQLRDHLLNGYDGTVGVDDCKADESNEPCDGYPGEVAQNFRSELQHLVDSDSPFHIVIFDTVSGQGSNLTYNIWGFLGVKLIGFNVTGAESERYFDFEFVRLVRPGNCCIAFSDRDTGIRGIRLCAVDHDPHAVDQRCALI